MLHGLVREGVQAAVMWGATAWLTLAAFFVVLGIVAWLTVSRCGDQGEAP